MACACGWFAACICSLSLVESRTSVRIISAVGGLVASSAGRHETHPEIPGHFSRAEWIALAIWLLIGALNAHLRPPRARYTNAS